MVLIQEKARQGKPRQTGQPRSLSNRMYARKPRGAQAVAGVSPWSGFPNLVCTGKPHAAKNGDSLV